MKKLIGILILHAMLFAIRTNAETYYVSPSGSDSNPGTIDKPFASWQKLSSVLRAGDIAYIRGGTYRTPKAIGDGNYPVDWRNVNGTSSAHITVSAYPGESPVLNLDNVVESVFMVGFYLGNSSYIDFKGLRITGLKQNPGNVQLTEGWRVDLCNQITFTQCEVDHIEGPGWRITQSTPTSSVFTYTNCDAHHCGDPYNSGGGVYGNADGFDANGGTVTYTGCRAWWNSDDGFDTFYNDSQVTYTNCWSFWNGFIPGTFTDPGGQADGMGFKWGSTTSDLRTTHLRTFTNCVVFQNKLWGFDQNVARCIAWFYNNTSYQNGFKNTSHANGTGGGWAAGYNINPPVAIVLKNNISYDDPTSVSNNAGLIQDHNTWNNLSASNSSFASLDTSGVTRPRQSDGSLPALQFLHLSAGSNLINAGVSIANLLFGGAAPDLGAFEYSGSSPVNQPPVANAGKSQVIVLPISLAILDGISSSDPDGIIKSYNWSQTAGPSSAIILTPGLVTTNVTTLVQGIYTFQLTVTDDKGAIGKDTVTITVNKETNQNNGSNQLPVANAGSDITVTLPANNVTLNGSGSDPDGKVSSYKWDEISGPACTIANPEQPKTAVNNLTQGVYNFELAVTDDKGAIRKDTVRITVNKESDQNNGSNQLPLANAGSDITVTLPTNNVTLNGSGSDPDGKVSSYKWDEISGPACTIENPDQAKTTVNNLTQGAYVFELEIRDDQNGVGRDTVQLIVDTVSTTSARYVKVNIYGGENPYTNSQWNNWDVKSSFNSSVFYYSDGTTSPVNANLSFNWSVLDNGEDYGQGAVAPGIVLRYAGYTRRTRTLTIHGLSSSRKYNLEFLASQNRYSDNITVFQVGQFSDSVFTYNNYMNKAVFTDLLPDDQGQLTITISTPNGYNYLNGFVLTENNNNDTLKITSGSPQNETEIVNNSKPSIEGPSLSVYPNPVSDKFYLDINNIYMGKMKVSIINQAGAEAGSYIFNKDQQRTHIDLSAKDLVPGIYFVRIAIGNWSEVRKIVKL